MSIHKSIWGAGGSAAEIPINDAGAAADEVWSAEKISAELAGLDKYTRAEVDALIADLGGAVLYIGEGAPTLDIDVGAYYLDTTNLDLYTPIEELVPVEGQSAIDRSTWTAQWLNTTHGGANPGRGIDGDPNSYATSYDLSTPGNKCDYRITIPTPVEMFSITVAADMYSNKSAWVGTIQVKTNEGDPWTSVQTINFPSSSNYTEKVTRTVELTNFPDPVGFINFNVDLPSSNGVNIWDLSGKGVAYVPQYFWRVAAGFSEKAHAHTESDITDLDKYTQTEVDALLSGLAAAGHDHFVAPPASAVDTGTKGQWSYDAGYLYRCVDTNTWVRWAVLTSW